MLYKNSYIAFFRRNKRFPDILHLVFSAMAALVEPPAPPCRFNTYLFKVIFTLFDDKKKDDGYSGTEIAHFK